MVLGIDIQIDGRRKNMKRDETQSLLEEAAAEIEDIAKNNAPVKTGTLVNSISVGHLTSRSAKVTASCDYAKYQEDGTRNVPAQKFMETAMNEVKSKYSGTLTFSKQKA